MPALGGSQPLGVQFRDYSGEVKSIQNLYSGEITAVSIAGFLSDFGDLQTALNAVTLGVMSATSWGERTIISNDRAATKDAQIETEMLVSCRGAVTEAPFSFRIPTVDYTAFNYADPPAGDVVILTGAGATAATTALIAALVALCKAPWDETEAIEVMSMRVVR